MLKRLRMVRGFFILLVVFINFCLCFSPFAACYENILAYFFEHILRPFHTVVFEGQSINYVVSGGENSFTLNFNKLRQVNLTSPILLFLNFFILCYFGIWTKFIFDVLKKNLYILFSSFLLIQHVGFCATHNFALAFGLPVNRNMIRRKVKWVKTFIIHTILGWKCNMV